MLIAASLGFAFAAFAFLVVGVLSAVGWQGGRIGGLLIAACVGNCIWAAMLSLEGWVISFPGILLIAAEFLHLGLWLSFLSALLARQGFNSGISLVIHAGWPIAMLMAATLSIRSVQEAVGFDSASVVLPGGLFLSFLSLLLLEQLYRNANREERKNVMPLIIGLASVFVFDLFLYSEAYLFGGYDVTSWGARGFVNAMAAGSIAIAARRNAGWDLDLFVSRHVVFYTTTLLAVGGYFVLVATGGFLIQLYGGQIGGVMRWVFIAGAVLVLLTVLSSDALRSRLRIFLNKHFFRNRYDYRYEWLRLVGTIGASGNILEPRVLVGALGDIVGSRGGAAWCLEQGGSQYTFNASLALAEDPDDLDTGEPIVKFMSESGWIVDLNEYRRNPSLYQYCAIPSAVESVENAWLVVPLQARDVMMGIVLLQAPENGPFELNYEDRDILKTAGNHLAVHLERQYSETALIQARQFETYNRLAAFLMHDLSNLLAQQSLIVKNAEKHRDNPDFIDDALNTVTNSVERMDRLLRQLKDPDRRYEARSTQLRFMLSAAVDRCAGRKPEPELLCDDTDLQIAIDPERFIAVITHLIRNAQDATADDGSVSVNGRVGKHQICVDVIDTGAGMSRTFVRDRLFKPFDSTKGAEGMGIGVYQVREFARSLGGDLTVETETGQGSRFSLCIDRKMIDRDAELVGVA